VTSRCGPSRTWHNSSRRRSLKTSKRRSNSRRTAPARRPNSKVGPEPEGYRRARDLSPSTGFIAEHGVYRRARGLSPSTGFIAEHGVWLDPRGLARPIVA
jgi:hypothetical protein